MDDLDRNRRQMVEVYLNFSIPSTYIELLKEFMCLGSVVLSLVSCETDIKRRIAIARSTTVRRNTTVRRT